MTTIATIPFGLIGAHTSIFGLSVAMFVRGMGIGFAFMPAMAAAFASLERSELADATPQLNVLQRVGGSIGTAVLAVVLQRALVGVHTLEGAAQRLRHGLLVVGRRSTALAIVPCIVLVRAERAAREAKGDSGAAAEPPTSRGRGGGGMTARRRRAAEALEQLGRSFKGAMARGAAAARARDAPARRAQLRPVQPALRPRRRRRAVRARARAGR